VPDNDNFAPRLGIYWDATGDGRTSVRGGYGIFYSSVVSIVDTLERLYGPSASESWLARTAPSDPRRTSTRPRRRSPYAQQWSVGLEREWAPDLSVAVDLNYVRGSDLLRPFDGNAPSFFDYTASGSRSSAAADVTRPFGVSDYRDLYLTGSGGSSRFWGVRVQATKRYQTSFTLQAVYQWSRTTNDGDDYRIEESLPLDPGRPDSNGGEAPRHPALFRREWSLGRPTVCGSRRSPAPLGPSLDPRVEADLDGD
jgi:hypothetical protein